MLCQFRIPGNETKYFFNKLFIAEIFLSAQRVCWTMKGLKRIEAVHTTIFMLLILYFMLVILACGAASNGPHSNIHSLESLKKKHNFGPSTENETTFRDEEYDSCMSTILQSTTKDAIFGPFYLFVIEFSPITCFNEFNKFFKNLTTIIL